MKKLILFIIYLNCCSLKAQKIEMLFSAFETKHTNHLSCSLLMYSEDSICIPKVTQIEITKSRIGNLGIEIQKLDTVLNVFNEVILPYAGFQVVDRSNLDKQNANLKKRIFVWDQDLLPINFFNKGYFRIRTVFLYNNCNIFSNWSFFKVG